MKIKIFRHSAGNTAGSLMPILQSLSDDIEIIITFHDDVIGSGAEDADLLVVLGGHPGVYQLDAYPFMQDEIRIIAHRAAKDLPTLGICLGSQLMAKALGADVYPGKAGVEKGWKPLALTEEGKKSPARHLGGDHTQMFHWHGDHFDLPQGAVRLASTDLYENQIYSYGKNLIGLQCHPEVTPLIINNWLVAAAGLAARGEVDINALRASTDKHLDTLIPQSALFLNEWLENTGLKS